MAKNRKSKFGLEGLAGQRRQAIRRKAAGNDPNLGSQVEARLRGPAPVTPGPAAPQGQTKITSNQNPFVTNPVTSNSTWYHMLGPSESVSWQYYEPLYNIPTIANDTSDVQTVLTVTQPRTTALVILEWTPVVLQRDTAVSSSLMVETPSEYFAGSGFNSAAETEALSNLVAALNIDGRGRIGASVPVVLDGTANPVTTQTVTGTRYMNRRAWVADPTFPVTLIVPPTSTLTLDFYYYNEDNLISNANIIVGAKLLTFTIPSSQYEIIKQTRG